LENYVVGFKPILQDAFRFYLIVTASVKIAANQLYREKLRYKTRGNRLHTIFSATNSLESSDLCHEGAYYDGCNIVGHKCECGRQIACSNPHQFQNIHQCRLQLAKLDGKHVLYLFLFNLYQICVLVSFVIHQVFTRGDSLQLKFIFKLPPFHELPAAFQVTQSIFLDQWLVASAAFG